MHSSSDKEHKIHISKQTLKVTKLNIPNLYFFTENNETCVTPDEHQGNCVLMDDCASLSALRKKRPISLINTNFLILSICGSQGKIPKVCCRTEIAKTGKQYLHAKYYFGIIATQY